MSLDPEINKAISETIKAELTAIISEVNKPILDQMEKQQRDYKRLSDTLSKTTSQLQEQFTKQIEDRFNAISPSLEMIEEIKQQKQETPKRERKKADVDVKAENQEIDLESLKSSVADELKKQYEAKYSEIQNQLAERDRETLELREKERKNRMVNEVINTMRSLGSIRPNTEADLLTLLEKRGYMVEDNDKFFIRSQDKFGDPINVDVKEILPKMLESEFAHFAVPRSGTGTSASPGSQQTFTSQYNFKGMSPQEIYDTYGNDKDAQSALIQVLEQQYGKYK